MNDGDDDDTDNDDTDDDTDDHDDDDDDTDDDNDHKNDAYTAAGAAPGASLPCSLFWFLWSWPFGVESWPSCWARPFVEIRKTGNPLLRREVAGCRQAWPGQPGRKKKIVKKYSKKCSAPVSAELEPKKNSDKVS